MRILIVGNGGREHTLAWKLRRDAPAATLFVTQPNGGMAGAADAGMGASAPRNRFGQYRSPAGSESSRVWTFACPRAVCYSPGIHAATKGERKRYVSRKWGKK